MLRSMYSGISGMKNFQTKLDVIGNNIANVNTYGFKKGRVTFKDTMNQMISGATAATENRGGKNPTQVGLGSALATIDTIHSGTSLQTTGRSLDLGIDGDGYFVVRQGDGMMYTRAGNFYLDDNGTLVNSDGLNVQAFKYDDNGNLTNVYGDVVINVNAILPGVETTGIKFSENLSANATTGTVFSQQIKVIDDKGRKQDATVFFKKLGENQWGLYANEVPNPSKVTTTGDIKITNPESYSNTTNTQWKLSYQNDNGTFKYFLNIDGNDIEMELNSITKKLQAKNSADQGKLMGLQIDLSAVVKPASATVESESTGSSVKIAVKDASGYLGNTDLDWEIRYIASMPVPNDANWVSPGYYIKDKANQNIIPIANPNSELSNGENVVTIPGRTDTITLSISGIQPVDPPGSGATAEDIARYDEYSSLVSNIKINHKTPKEPANNTTEEIGNIIITAATQPDHTLNFIDGRIPNNNAYKELTFKIPTGVKDDPDTIANESTQSVTFNFDFSTLTQYDGTTSAMVDPNGNLEGKLESFNIGSLGEINGVYSNGEIVTIGQLALAKFSNTSGLTKAGNNLFQESINSGTPDINVAGEGRGVLASGSLEMSNVDLSEEFTEMITAQRGFQANTRIITTSDEILQELVNLKR